MPQGDVRTSGDPSPLEGGRRARIVLLCGKTGSGKTTFARRLEAAGAMRFSTDEWMIRLFGHHMSRELFTQRLATCEALVLELAAQLAQRGVDSVIDNGFWRRAARDAARAVLASVPADVELVYFDVADAVLARRLRERNAALPEATFEITPEMFELFSSWFEPPAPEECARMLQTADTESS